MRKIILSAILASTMAAAAFAASDTGNDSVELLLGPDFTVSDEATASPALSVSALTFTVSKPTDVSSFLKSLGATKVQNDAKNKIFTAVFSNSKKVIYCAQKMDQKKSSTIEVVCSAKQDIVEKKVSAAQQKCEATT